MRNNSSDYVYCLQISGNIIRFLIGSLGGGSEWPDRHLIWITLGALAAPHIVAFAHPSYSQMFTTAVLPVIAIALARVDAPTALARQRLILSLAGLIAICHIGFGAYLAVTRL